MSRRLLVSGLVLLVAGCSDSPPSGVSSAPTQPPEYQHVLPAFGGHLLGANGGEWGGELAFRSDTGETTPLIAKNVVALYKAPFGYVVVAGLAHLSTNQGELLLVTQDTPGKLTVDRLAKLPYAPVAASQRKDGAVDLVLFTGKFEGPSTSAAPVYECMRLRVNRSLVPIGCSGVAP